MYIQLRSSDGETFQVDHAIVRLSSTLDGMFKDLGLDDPDSNALTDSIPINVTGGILKRVIEFCEHHKNDAVDKGSFFIELYFL